MVACRELTVNTAPPEQKLTKYEQKRPAGTSDGPLQLAMAGGTGLEPAT